MGFGQKRGKWGEIVEQNHCCCSARYYLLERRILDGFTSFTDGPLVRNLVQCGVICLLLVYISVLNFLYDNFRLS